MLKFKQNPILFPQEGHKAEGNNVIHVKPSAKPSCMFEF